jgi:hypothetical protein
MFVLHSAIKSNDCRLTKLENIREGNRRVGERGKTAVNHLVEHHTMPRLHEEVVAARASTNPLGVEGWEMTWTISSWMSMASKLPMTSTAAKVTKVRFLASIAIAGTEPGDVRRGRDE